MTELVTFNRRMCLARGIVILYLCFFLFRDINAVAAGIISMLGRATALLCNLTRA